MVYFVNDEVNKDWSVVVHLKPRDSYDIGGNEDDEACENEPWLEQNLNSLFENGDNLSDEIYQSKRGTKIYFAAAAANSSQDKLIAATNSSRDKSAASNTSQVKSVAATNSSRDTLAAAANFSQHKLTTGANFSRDKLTAAANSSRDKSAASNSSRDKLVAVASSSRDKSATSNSSEPSSVAPTISNHPSEPKHKRGRESNHYWTVDAIEEYEDSTRLHLLVRNVHNLPEGLRIVVNFDKQHAVIGEAAGLLAGVCGQLATNCVAFPISFDKLSDIPKSFFENQWKILSLNLCKRNKEIRQKQIISHTSGAKSIARRRAELEKIEAYSSQQAVESTVNSPLDALGVVLGKEHPGGVHGLGMGVVLTVAFKNNTTKIN
ncbi:uncharacterized protein LOC107489542 [Arachis duranensis]|uniref:Uncharacterized protein LOC107489542 n=1 Tax=Arachis duranensis TaxID=130453 RepID=A0A6P5NRS0_ARADU|nr:uncharacterized protein LOC107489542 [Arachis duranensis]